MSRLQPTRDNLLKEIKLLIKARDAKLGRPVLPASIETIETYSDDTGIHDISEFDVERLVVMVEELRGEVA